MKLFKTVRVARAVTIIVMAACAVAACGSSAPPTPEFETVPATPTVSSLPNSVVGTVPAGSTKEAAATTSPVKSQMSKEEESAAMPLPGQANDHSTLSPQASQKSGEKKR